MEKLLNQLILIAGAWSESKDPSIEIHFSVLFEELKQITGLNHAAAENLLMQHINGKAVA